MQNELNKIRTTDLGPAVILSDLLMDHVSGDALKIAKELHNKLMDLENKLESMTHKQAIFTVGRDGMASGVIVH